jgi:hypothetical protein
VVEHLTENQGVSGSLSSIELEVSAEKIEKHGGEHLILEDLFSICLLVIRFKHFIQNPL